MPHATGPAIEPSELALGVRNHAMPQEALRYDVTPAGLHYLLIHYDIPAVDPTAFRLSIGGHVARPLTLTMDDLRARPSVTATVTLECAGNGRALLDPRPISQPWLHGAVGNATWTGTPLAPLLAEADPLPGAVDVGFAGLDHGIEGDVEQDYERGLSFAEATRPEVFLAYEMNGRALFPQHGFPLRLVVPGWYGMAHVKWLTRITVLDEPFAGYQNMVSYRRQRDEDDLPGEPVERIRVRSLLE
ncbi:MAG TPA: molybdopterin-dependent oxidoreductase, partial [Phycicoccus sp.]